MDSFGKHLVQTENLHLSSRTSRSRTGATALPQSSVPRRRSVLDTDVSRQSLGSVFEGKSVKEVSTNLPRVTLLKSESLNYTKREATAVMLITGQQSLLRSHKYRVQNFVPLLNLR